MADRETSTDQGPAENSIAPSDERQRASAPHRDPTPDRPDPAERRRSFLIGDMPAPVERRYLSEAHGALERRYYENASDTRPMFRDQGARLVAETESRAVIRDLVAVAAHRGWDKIVVRGTPAFRREAWREATTLGLEVEGYRPTERDLQATARSRETQVHPASDRADGTRAPGAGDRSATQRRGDERPTPAPPARPDFSRGVVGRVLDTGRAPYQGKPGARPTPFVDLELPDGRTERAWGVGLPAALGDAGKGIGDRVRLTRVGREPVNISVTSRDQETGETRRSDRAAQRNRWLVESVAERGSGASSGRGRPASDGDHRGRAAPGDDERERRAPNETGHRVRERDRVEAGFNVGDEMLGVRTAPTRDTSQPTRAPGRPKDDDRWDDRTISRGAARGAAERTADGRTDEREAGAGRQTRDEPTDPRPGRKQRDGGPQESRALNQEARARALELADRFRHSSSAEAARDPDLRAAQSQFIAAKALARAYLPNDPRAALVAERLRERIARQIERGHVHGMARSRTSETGSPELVVGDVQRTAERGEGRGLRKRPGAITKSPERIRGR